MKKLLTISAALATVLASLASPAFAAPPKHRAPIEHDTMTPYAQFAHEQMLNRPSDVVTFDGRVIGADPDGNIRTQLQRDPEPGF